MQCQCYCWDEPIAWAHQPFLSLKEGAGAASPARAAGPAPADRPPQAPRVPPGLPACPAPARAPEALGPRGPILPSRGKGPAAPPGKARYLLLPVLSAKAPPRSRDHLAEALLPLHEVSTSPWDRGAAARLRPGRRHIRPSTPCGRRLGLHLEAPPPREPGAKLEA